MRTIVLTTIVLIMLMSATNVAANPTIFIGWSEQHGERGGVVSYLKGIAIPEEPPYRWTRRLSILEFEQRIRSIAPVSFVYAVNINSYADTNHVNRVTITSLSGSHTISAQQLR